MDPRYLEAVVNEDAHKVLGRRLHPFCFYDALILEIDENPLWMGHRDVTWGDLFNAALICSSDPEMFLVPSRMRGFWRWIRNSLWVSWGRRRYKLTAEVEKFRAYIKDFYSKPHMWSSSDSKRSGAPWILSVASYIECHSNLTEEQVMRAPIGKMMWKYGTIAEMLHGAEMVSDEEQAGIKALGLKI